MAVKEVRLTVRCPVQAGESLAVSGSVAELGSWRRGGLLHMARGQGDLWHVTFPLDSEPADVFYRYCVVAVLPTAFLSSGRRVIVRRWEGHLHPRQLAGDTGREEEFGQVDGLTRIQRGWLTDETLVQIKLEGGGLDLWRRKEAGGRVFAKLTALDRRKEGEGWGEESLDMAELREAGHRGAWPIVEAAALTEAGCARREQAEHGAEYCKEEGSFLMFEIQLLHPGTVAFLIDIYTKPEGAGEEDTAKHVGMGFIYPENFKQTTGRLQTPITSLKFQPIGSLSVDYLVVRPLPEVEMDFSVTYRKYWSAGWSGLDVGHRGLGNSYTQGGHCSHVKENTLASMQDAVLHGADMVEFDVQVSRDLVPCIFHEFSICVVTKTKQNEEVMIDVPVKDLSLKELQGLRSHHPTEKESGVKSFATEGVPEHESFPTLSNVLVGLDSSCGANIEVKYGQTMKDGTKETQSQMDMNIFVDQILKTVLRESGDRKIVFSSFSPDICTMLAFKQNRYPVLLLTQGINSIYQDYSDPRTWSIKSGVLFAEMAGLLGVSAMAEALLRDPGQLDMVRQRGQVLFAWTDYQNDLATVQQLKKLGVDGVIYDRMDQHNEKPVKESIFLRESVQKQKYASSLGTSSNYSASPGSTPEHIPSPSFSGVVFAS